MRGRDRRRSRPRTTVTDPAATPAPNLVQQQFAVTTVDTLWVGDLTYLPTDEGWLYLATLLDACSRRVVGWAMTDHLRTELPLTAPRMALRQRRPAPGQLVHHTDRGCRYTAHPYQAERAAYGMRGSMSRAGDCYDNALAESFLGTLKAELVEQQLWATRAEARRAVFAWLAMFYHRQRRHSALAYLSPAAFEAQQSRAQAA